MINAVLDIKLLAREEWRVLRATRLRALRDSPHAFASQYAVEVNWGEAQWRLLLDTATWVVAVESGVIIGIAALVGGNGREGPHVESIWVAPTHRNLGVFRALLQTLVEHERGNTARDLSLWVIEDNHNAKAAYLRLGFVPTGERQLLSGERHEVRLRREIQP